MMPNEYAKYVVGGGVHISDAKYELFENENHTFHTSERTAKADAEGRMALQEKLLKMLSQHRDDIRKMRETP